MGLQCQEGKWHEIKVSRKHLQTLIMKNASFFLLHDKYIRTAGSKCGIVALEWEWMEATRAAVFKHSRN